MTSVLDSVFIMKYDFYNNEIKQYSKVKIITLINNAYLVEDINTKKRIWVMKYDIYPISNHDCCGYWEYNENFQQLI